ncbi:hypothetical protein AQUCO_01600276v1 [Aquilegia coerulea]|uniref:Uncharacterized protein n=1 Tax=Aquilegia coerulea TaxID=218851 RepID=A0A2G5DQX8_AQUCA|nr:hypothetical protein AQUCO_01600276v1 [Aquilegia coerulea]
MWTGSKGRFRHWREYILEAEAARNECEVKTWGLDATLRQIFKELETPSVECNQAIRRLKRGDYMQYKLNGKGSTPAATNQQSQDNNSRVEEKTNCLTEVQSQDKSRLSLMKKELKSYISMCYTEANQITEVLNERHISWALWKEKQKFF